MSWRKWLFVILLFGLLPVAFAFIHSYWQRRAAAEELRLVLAEIDQADPGWRLEQIEAKRRVVTDDKNSALKVLAAYRLLPKDWQYTVRDELDKLPPPVQLSANVIVQLRKELDEVSQAVGLARKLVNYPEGRFAVSYAQDWINTIVEDQVQTRRIAELLLLDVYALAQAEKGDQAWHSARALLNAGRSLGDEPSPMMQLVRMALQNLTVNNLERTLAQGTVSDLELATMQQVLIEEAGENLFLIGIRGERAGMDRCFTHLASGSVSITVSVEELVLRKPKREAEWIDQFNDWFQMKIVYRSHAWLAQFHTQVIEAAATKGAARYRKMHQLDEAATSLKIAAVKNRDVYLAAALVTSMKHAYAEQRLDTLLHCTIAGLAAERFRLKQDRWPASLDELIQAKLLKEAPEDLYNGQPIRLRRAADGIVFYSVGKDGDYPGDALDRLADFNPNRIRVEFRLWDPPRRRQAPLPQPKVKNDE